MLILLIRAGSLGDVLLLRETIAGLQGAGHEVALLAPSPAAQALIGTGLCEVRQVIPWERADVASLLISAEPPDSLRASLSGFQLAVAYTRSEALASSLRQVIADVRVRDPTPQARHSALWLFEAVRDLASLPDPIPLCTASPDEDADAQSILGQLAPRFLAIHPGSGSSSKNWPVEHFVDLVPRLARGERWLLIEGPADRDAAARLAELPGAVVARELGLRVLGSLLSRAGIYVGNDSGVSHLAAAWGAPTLALFGRTDPARWSPRGRRVSTLQAADRSMGSLAVEQVLIEAMRAREQGNPS